MMKNSVVSLVVIGLVAMFLFVACSGSGEVVQPSTANTTTPVTGGNAGAPANGGAGLGQIAITPDPAWHDQYLVGAHASFSCADCHVTGEAVTLRVNARETPGEEICLLCHANDFSSASLLNHTETNTGGYCNSCHFSDSFTSHARMDASQYHDQITGSCDFCHTGSTPTNHLNSERSSGCDRCHQYTGGQWGTSAFSGEHLFSGNCSNCHIQNAPGNHYGQTCENCHSYPTWDAATFVHGDISSDCDVCHQGHNDRFAAYECEWCHTFGISWRFSHRNVRPAACSGCHGSGEGFDEGGEDDENDGHGDGNDDHDDD